MARAAEWLRCKYGCGIILSEQYCASGEVPDVIGWKGFCQSVLVECKVSRSDFLADANKPFRLKPEEGTGQQALLHGPGRNHITPKNCRSTGGCWSARAAKWS